VSVLAADLAGALDAASLARRLSIVPDPWQETALRSTASRALWLCCRQSGKSTTAAVLGLWTALYRPGSCTLIVSPGQRQSQLVFAKVAALYRQLGRPVASEAENQLSLRLENGAQVVSLPGDGETVRGYTADLLIADEAAQIRDPAMDALLPTLAVSGGRLVAMSTPAGRRGWFFDAWEHGGPGWERVKLTAEGHPRIPASAVDDYRSTRGDFMTRQEYLCEFIDDAEAVFGEALVAAMFSDAVAPLFGD